MSKIAEKRQQLAKELRATHFNLGYDDISKDNSEYINKYKEWNIHNDGNAGESLGLKKSHFVLGTDGMKDPYKSLYQREHIPFEKTASSALDVETLKDLRKHHFELGSDKGLPKSEAQENFIARDLPTGVREELAQVMKRNKQNNLSFPDTTNYYSSIYNEAHNKNIDPTNPHRGFNKDDLQKQVSDLQSTHIVLGSSNDDFGTSMRNAFLNKHGNYERAKPTMDLMHSNFVAGTDEQPTESLYKHFHKKHPIEVVKLNEELQKDLRAHHFKFGDRDVQYESTAAGTYKEPSAENYKTKEEAPHLYKNHFYLGDSKPEYQTSYSASHHQLDQNQPNKASDNRRDRTSNIVLGYDNNQVRSETQSQFVQFQNAKKAKLDDKMAKDLRQSHFNFDGPTSYESYAHATYKDVLDKARDLNPNGVTKNLADDLRKHHFDYGTDPKSFGTSQRDAYKGLSGKSSQLEKELAHDLRRNHFDIGLNNKTTQDTSYRTNFNWKVNADE